MSLQNKFRCSKCVSWLPYDGSSWKGICVEKCKRLAKRKGKYVSKERDPVKISREYCRDFVRKE